MTRTRTTAGLLAALTLMTGATLAPPRPDLEIEAAIRQAIVTTPTMSLAARHVGIDSNNGQVVLTGPVASAKERDAIEKIAVTTKGVKAVTSRLTPPPP